MISLTKEKIAAIVPALNEEATVGQVLKVLLSSKDLDEVILVDDGSSDKTAEIAKNLGAKIVSLTKIGGSGKGNAMKQGAKLTDAGIIIFFDADLVGLSEKHISLLIEPMLKENIEMCVGVRDRWGGLPGLIAKIDPLMAIGGERAIKKSLFEKIPDKFFKEFAIETGLNHYCLSKNIPIKYVILENLQVITKERKLGIFKGFISRLKMITQIVIIRLALLADK